MKSKLLKKVVALSVASVMSIGLFAGCGAKKTETSSTSAAASTAATEEKKSDSAETPAAPAAGDIKIGVSIWSSTDVLGSQCKKIIDEAASALGVTVQYVDQGHVSEQVTSSVEKLCAAGCQGIIICNSADTEMTSAINTCNQQGVYLAQFFRIINSETSADIYQMGKDSKFFVGAVHENEVENGQKLAQILLDRGDRNIGLIGWEQGDATWLGRWEGYTKGVEEWNAKNPSDQAKLSEPQYAGTTSEGGAKAADALMSADPTLDALIPAGGGGEPLLGALQAIQTKNKAGEIDVVSTDFLPDLGDRLKNGTMAGQSGGHYCDPLFAFMMVYNAVLGNYKDIEGNFKEINFPYLYVSSPEEYEAYETYFVKQLPYTKDELVAMSTLSFDELAKTAANLSIADAKARSGK